jgi:hypothetical protein
MAARLEGDIKSGAARGFAGPRQSQDLGMRPAEALVMANAYELSLTHDHGTH